MIVNAEAAPIIRARVIARTPKNERSCRFKLMLISDSLADAGQHLTGREACLYKMIPIIIETFFDNQRSVMIIIENWITLSAIAPFALLFLIILKSLS